MSIAQRIYDGMTRPMRLLHPATYRAYVLQAVAFVQERRYLPLSQYRKYLTPYRILLLSMALPVILFTLLKLPYRQELALAYILLTVLTFVVEVMLFAMQFTRRESVYIELLLMILLLPFGYMMM
ncbi:MAG: hypothetical protein J0L80_07160 [Chitinophagales bacterium]|nr:hypothetical protein [Chitinophagales bacterium]